MPTKANIRPSLYRCKHRKDSGEVCGHEWLTRKLTALPKVCPKCKSPYWLTGIVPPVAP